MRSLSKAAHAGGALVATGAWLLACSSADDVLTTPVDATPDAAVVAPPADASAPPEPVVDGSPGDAPVEPTPVYGALPPPLDLTNVTPGDWAWFDFPNVTFCRDGSTAGLAVNPSPSGSKKVMFFFEGGGACFDLITCALNNGHVEHKSGGSGGVFDRSNPDNPFADYTYAFVPYCTGDVHAGNKYNGNIANVGAQKFVGYLNSEYFLKKIAATFPNTERLVVTGESAGGFGAAANFLQAVRIFPSIPVNLVDDSGPFMRSPTLPTCLQKRWQDTYGFDGSIIAECGEDCVGKADYLTALAQRVMSKSKSALGLISATGDETIRLFFGFGANNCKGLPSSVSVSAYTEGLADITTQFASYTNFGAFLYEGTNHTVLSGGKFYSTVVDGKSTAQWVRGIVDTDTVSNVGP